MLCANCFTKTDPLTEHRSEVEPPLVFCPDCCPGGLRLSRRDPDCALVSGRHDAVRR